MNPEVTLIVFALALCAGVGGLWLRLVGIILRGDWPPLGLAQSAPALLQSRGRQTDHLGQPL